ncbi:hypothetical protein BGZ96_008020 [Linnemannia gamsii]|uniref:Uncharacterized protein n=1 Tax=Linnemannia gamsii TaxID=64522 RepID=A0ABQ7KFT5_9FUNG|nr:hypothetical protein BGZ96_008020 [Linnemannia gamsii]
MASHLYNLRDTEKTHHYNLRDTTASATKDKMLHTTAEQQHPHQQNEAHAQAGPGHVQGQEQDHAQMSHTGQQHQHQHQQHQQHQKRDHPAAVQLATGTEANLEHPVHPEHDPTHPGH